MNSFRNCSESRSLRRSCKHQHNSLICQDCLQVFQTDSADGACRNTRSTVLNQTTINASRLRRPIKSVLSLRNVRCRKKTEFSILCSVTKVVGCYLLDKRMATFTIVPYCQQIAEHPAPAIPQSIRGRIPHSIFRILQSIFTPLSH